MSYFYLVESLNKELFILDSSEDTSTYNDIDCLSKIEYMEECVKAYKKKMPNKKVKLVCTKNKQKSCFIRGCYEEIFI